MDVTLLFYAMLIESFCPDSMCSCVHKNDHRRESPGFDGELRKYCESLVCCWEFLNWMFDSKFSYRVPQTLVISRLDSADLWALASFCSDTFICDISSCRLSWDFLFKSSHSSLTFKALPNASSKCHQLLNLWIWVCVCVCVPSFASLSPPLFSFSPFHPLLSSLIPFHSSFLSFVSCYYLKAIDFFGLLLEASIFPFSSTEFLSYALTSLNPLFFVHEKNSFYLSFSFNPVSL